MKYYKQLLCGLLCFACLFGLFSVTAKAATTTFPKFHANTTVKLWPVGNAAINIGSGVWYPYDNDTSKSFSFEQQLSNSSYNYDTDWYITHTLAADNKTALITGTEHTTVTIQNIAFEMFLENTEGDEQYFHWPDLTSIKLYSRDGQVFTPDEMSITHDSYWPLSSVTFSFIPTVDIYKIAIELHLDTGNFSKKDSEFRGYVDPCVPMFAEGEELWIVNVEQEEPEVGLLQGVINWLKNVRDSIVNGLQSVVDWLGDVWASINALPDKIGSAIENSLKSLFIPTQQQITKYKANFDMLLADRLGAVYEVGDIIIESWSQVSVSDVQNELEFPEFSIDLPDNTQFTFGGYQVKIVPEGFEFLATACKAIIGIVCTFAFVNGLRKRYEEIVGVEK